MDPTFLLIQNMNQAEAARQAILRMLKDRQVKHLEEFTVRVEFVIKHNEFVYGYNLRVFPRNSTTPVINLWAETRDELLSDVNIITLLMLYNS